MKRKTISIQRQKLELVSTRVAVIGSGTAALNAAVHLKRLGVDDVTIMTEKLGAGTSANTGSDKQTYYRLNPTADQVDSTRQMAEDLFSGHCMHGDIAQVEAALSLREFYHLVELGVPFPRTRFGDYIGYQTDHDVKSRGTSAGPDTSILMVEKLLAEARREQIQIMENLEVIELLKGFDKNGEEQIVGFVAMERTNKPGRIVLVQCDFVVFGTGGPGALYEDSVYPLSQIGSLGMALKAGIKAQNLTESQFGLASKGFRWNLSGSYQQVLPSYFSSAADGGDRRPFLNPHFPDPETLFTAQFLKGYQWPFDVRKIADYGSSTIDLFVLYETKVLGRRVFMDFTRNPEFKGTTFSVEQAPGKVREYLQNSAATGQTPVERLLQMNAPAFELFLKNGTNLAKEPLEIAVCNQHCNGGLVGNIWWESSLRNFFSVGECNGTHGIYRPGGSALNSGQVGSLRAAEQIAFQCQRKAPNSASDFTETVAPLVKKILDVTDNALKQKNKIDLVQERRKIQRRMSSVLGIVRNSAAIEEALMENRKMLKAHHDAGIKNRFELLFFLKNEDLLITERAMLESSKALLNQIKGGRGSFLIGKISDFFSKQRLLTLETDFEAMLPDNTLNDKTVEFRYLDADKVETVFKSVRPIPSEEFWFETVWADSKEGKVFEQE